MVRESLFCLGSSDCEVDLALFFIMGESSSLTLTGRTTPS